MTQFSLNRYAKFAWSVLAYNILVILWGAVVRATKSGAGCGSHWPSCNGEIVPLSAPVETMIEFTHRLSSGIALLLVAAILVWAFRAYPKGHRVRFGASLSSIFIITEALVGASLVLFGWVAEDESLGRTISISIHLVNTFLLLGSLCLTAWWASGGEWVYLSGQGFTVIALTIGVFGMLVLGVTGAITALGDTLFPSNTLAEGIREDFSPNAHFLVRLRVWHPVIAITVGFYLSFVAGLLAMLRSNPILKRITMILIGLYLAQLAAGIINLILMAPVWMQVIHLLLADLVWISFVLFSAVALAASGETVEAPGSKPVLAEE